MTKDETLRTLAEGCEFDIGAFDVWVDRLDDETYQEVLSSEFTMLTPGVALQMNNCRPSPETYDFENADRILTFGREHGMSVRGHVLVWHEGLPEWFDPAEYTDGEIRELLREHVRTTVGRYEGQIDAWDVANEAIEHDGDSFRRTPWYDALGEQYIDEVFRWAHETDPNADLYYNDYGADEINEKSDTIYDMVKRLLERDVPIDGVGFQLHALGDLPDPDSIAANVKRFRDLGLDVQITEMDVAYSREDVPNDPAATRAEYYRDVVDVCLETGVNALVTCGVHDASSWIRHYRDFSERFTGDPLLFDDDYQPKPAYEAVHEVLREWTSGEQQ